MQGWYWPAVGPQMTMYIPGPFLHDGENELILFELEGAPAKTAGNVPKLEEMSSLQTLCAVYEGNSVVRFSHMLQSLHVWLTLPNVTFEQALV